MITDYDVHLVRVKVFAAGNVDAPRVDPGEEGPEAADPSAGLQPEWITVRQPDDSSSGTQNRMRVTLAVQIQIDRSTRII